MNFVMLSKRSQKFPDGVNQQIEKWPSHAAGRMYASSNIVVSDGRLVVLPEAETKIPNLVPKPKLLSNLESRIINSLSTINMSDVDGRLQVFREVFQTLIETFKTYGPIFTQILREYEAAFNYYKIEAQKLRPIKEYLWTMSQECDEKVLTIQKREKPEMEHLRNKINKLKAIILDQKEEQTLMQLEIDKLVQSLQEEHARFRHESDARHLLISEINAMRSQYEELDGIARRTQSKEKEVGDPTMLRIALDKARQAQSNAEFELTRLRADYVDVVPKKQHEELFKTEQDLECQMEEQRAKYNELFDALKDCEEQLKSVTAERDDYFNALQQLKRTSTPRPDWNEIGRKLPCGYAKWTEDTRGMSTEQKLDVLLEELYSTGRDDRVPLVFEPKGIAESIPRFLRYEAQVYKRSIQPRDCLLLAYEIWNYRKSVRDSVKVKRNSTTPTSKSPIVLLNFDETLESFFNQTYSISKIRVEWAYGFYDALAKHKDYIALDELKKIIDNEMDESCHWHLQTWLEKVKAHVLSTSQKEQEDSINKNYVPKSMKRQNLMSALASVTGELFETKLNTLVAEAYRVCSPSRITLVESEAVHEEGFREIAEEPDMIENIEKLFQVVPGENYNPFLCELIGLYQAIKSNYIDEILTELHKSVDHENQGKRVSPAQLTNAIESVSPTTAITAENRLKSGRIILTETPTAMNLQASLDWIMRPNLGQDNAVESISMETLVARMTGANLYPNVENF